MRSHFIRPKWLAKVALVGVMAMTSTSAFAELLGYRFTDVHGEQREVSPDQTYINPASELTFYLRAGVDRRLEVELQDDRGRTIESNVSKLIGANDRIQYGGASHYGAILSLGSPEDGEFFLISRILSSTGATITEQQQKLIIHRASPVIGGFEIDAAVSHTFSGYEAPIIGGSRFQAVHINGVESEIPLDYVKIISRDKNTGSIFNATSSIVEGRASFNRDANIFPLDRASEYEVEALAYDVAGNAASLHFNIYADHTNGQSEHGYTVPVGIYDPAAFTGEPLADGIVIDGYIPYTPGIEISHNPVGVIFKVPKSNHQLYSPFGIGIIGNSDPHVGSKVVHEGTDFIYVKSQNDFRATQYGAGSYSYRQYDRMLNSGPVNVTWELNENAIIAPRLTGYYMGYSDSDSWVAANRRFSLSDKDVNLVRLKATVEPRDYTQQVRFRMSGSSAYRIDERVDVLPGKTEAYLDVNYNKYDDMIVNGGNNASAIYFQAFGTGEAEGLTSLSGVHRWIEADYTPPEVLGISLNESSVTVNTYESDYDRLVSHLRWRDYFVAFGRSFLEVQRSDGRWFELNPVEQVINDHWNREFIYSLNSAPDGIYSGVRATVIDSHGNTTVHQETIDLIIDSTPPSIEIITEQDIASLDDVSIRVNDNIDQNPVVTNARIMGGPANDDVNLATVRQDSSVPTFSLEYPVIFPSINVGEEYQLEVTARDANGNETVETKSFRFEPRVVSLTAEDGGAIQIPARVAAFLRNGGGDVVQSQPLLLSGGAPVAGTYDVYATLRTDAEVPLMINGVRVTPGDTQEIMGQHNFSTSGGRLSIPVYPAEDGVIGKSTILVTTTAPNAPVLLVDIETWEGDADFTGSGWDVRQVIDPLSYTAVPSSSTFCRFSTRESEARQADAVSNPTCFFAWDRLPGELKPVERRSAEEAIPSLEGIATDQGPHPLAYSLYMFDANGAKVKVGGGTRTLNVLSAAKAMEYAPIGDYSRINRVLDPIDLRMNQAAGPECVPTLSESAARSAAERYGHNPARRSCYFEWSQVPTGLDQAEGIDVPQLLGTIGDSGDHTLRWNAYIFSPEGYRVAVAQQTHTLTAVNPEAPNLNLTSDYYHEGDTYIVPQNRNSLGGLIVDGLPTDIRLDIKRGAEQIENDVFTAGWSERNRLVRNLRTGRTPVWQETLHSATAIYEKVPDIRTVGEYRVITAPSEDILPLLEMDSTTVLDTEPLKLTVKMRSMLDRDGDYDAGQMGNWRVRLLNQRTFSDQEPMTDWVNAANGDAAFEIEMERLTDAGLRLVAEAELISPIEGYERIVTSRPSFVQVLRGGAIDGEVTSRRFTGPAPLTAVFQIALEDRLDQQALGDVVWQVSADDGATWIDQEVDARRQRQFYHAFEEGEYLLRAFMRNRNSGAESHTEQVQIVSYTQPEVFIDGPGVLFVGDTYTYLAEVTVPETAKKSADEAIVEWSLDAGETWTHTGRELDLTSTEEARFALRARTRMPEAPEIDRNAYNDARLMVNFRDVVAPRVRVRSYTLLEEGRPYTIEASAPVPYRGMAYDMKGYFTLPDGTTREGQEIEYVPTLADAEAGSATFTYTAWVDGFKEETLSTGSSTSRVWQYVWPEFYVTQRLSTDVAPAQVSMSIRHRDGARNLDNPTYEWQLPEGIEELQERGDTTRLFKITEPGQHHVRVTVQDERGHSSLIEHVIELGVPAPYDINLRFTPSNSFMREPLDVRLRPTYRGGHPHDRVSNQRFRVNGEVVAEGANSTVATLAAGRHEVVFEIETNHGVEDQKSIFIDVAENQVPVCELELSESLRNWIVRANCTDEDGRVRKYHWLVNGEENTRTSNRLGLLKRDYDDEMPQVVLIAVDDSGGASQPVQVAE